MYGKPILNRDGNGYSYIYDQGFSHKLPPPLIFVSLKSFRSVFYLPDIEAECYSWGIDANPQ